MDDSALSVEQLDALSRAVPEEQELKDLALYLEVCCIFNDGRALRLRIWGDDLHTYAVRLHVP